MGDFCLEHLADRAAIGSRRDKKQTEQNGSEQQRPLPSPVLSGWHIVKSLPRTAVPDEQEDRLDTQQEAAENVPHSIPRNTTLGRYNARYREHVA